MRYCGFSGASGRRPCGGMGGPNWVSRPAVRFPMSASRMTLPTTLPSRRSLLKLTISGALTTGLPACAIPTRLAAVPRGRAGAAMVLGVPNERFFPLEPAGQAGLQREFVAAVQRQLLVRGLPPSAPMPELDL